METHKKDESRPEVMPQHFNSRTGESETKRIPELEAILVYKTGSRRALPNQTKTKG